MSVLDVHFIFPFDQCLPLHSTVTRLGSVANQRLVLTRSDPITVLGRCPGLAVTCMCQKSVCGSKRLFRARVPDRQSSFLSRYVFQTRRQPPHKVGAEGRSFFLPFFPHTPPSYYDLIALPSFSEQLLVSPTSHTTHTLFWTPFFGISATVNHPSHLAARTLSRPVSRTLLAVPQPRSESI